MAFKSFKHKIVDFGLKDGSFKDDAGKDVNYSQLVLRVKLEGDIEEIVLSGATAPKPKLLGTILRGADAIVLDKDGKIALLED